MIASQAVQVERENESAVPNSLELVIKCYSAAIKDLKEAKALHQAGSMNAVYDRLRHAQDLITELLVGLDYERGGTVAQNLSRIYNFLLRELIVIHTRQTTERYDQMIHILEDLKSAWEQVSR